MGLEKRSCEAGAGRQHNGRLGKIELSQVGVFLALVTPEVCTWIDGELYLPQAWFEESHVERRKQTGVPEELAFHTKPELGWQASNPISGRGDGRYVWTQWRSSQKP